MSSYLFIALNQCLSLPYTIHLFPHQTLLCLADRWKPSSTTVLMTPWCDGHMLGRFCSPSLLLLLLLLLPKPPLAPQAQALVAALLPPIIPPPLVVVPRPFPIPPPLVVSPPAVPLLVPVTACLVVEWCPQR